MAILQTRSTIRDIGRKTGYHYSTVSLALRDHPRIPKSTKQIIREAANGLGYQPDPMLSALCAYRLMKRPPKEQSVIAWLTNYRQRAGWRMSACTRDYFEGASQRSTERGYRLETFWLAEPGMTGPRMSRILWTRGVQGVLLPPQEQLTTIELAWENLSAVTFGYTLVHPRLHLVSNHEYRTMGTLFAELGRRDYQRVGLVNLRDHDKRVDNNWLAAYLVEQAQLQPQHQLPPLVLDQWNSKTFLSWVKHYRPDAIVTRLPEVLRSLRRAGYSVPDDLGVAYHTLDEKSHGLSGMKKNSFQLGVMAVDLLIDMLHRNERGIPVRPYLLMVEGSWVEGNTLRKPNELSASISARCGTPGSHDGLSLQRR
jgi:LacI family transcriptional regulator, galactose operon repressor